MRTFRDEDKTTLQHAISQLSVASKVTAYYRVFKYQVYFLKVVQLVPPWTNLHKFFFSDFLKVYIFCQVTKKKDFYSITAATKAECWVEIWHFFFTKNGHFLLMSTLLNPVVIKPGSWESQKIIATLCETMLNNFEPNRSNGLGFTGDAHLWSNTLVFRISVHARLLIFGFLSPFFHIFY